jgi:DNA-binding HxlR family transcriptional regulator
MEKFKSSPARSYGQYCGLARALDVVGDRWSLLVVRELLPGPMRYGDLLSSLNGIATNLLAERLRRLEASGVVMRRLGDQTGVEYTLTPWGAELREVVDAFVRWSKPVMVTGPSAHDAFEPRWLAVALPALLHNRVSEPPLDLGINLSGHVMNVHIDEHGPRVDLQPDVQPDTVVHAEPALILGIAAGAISIDDVAPHLTIDGDRHAVADVLTGSSA